MFTTLTTLAILIALLVLGWAVWFVIELVRYLASGEYAVDKRLESLTRR